MVELGATFATRSYHPCWRSLLAQQFIHISFSILNPRVCRQVGFVDYIVQAKATNLVVPKPNPVIHYGEREDMIYKRLAFGMIVWRTKDLIKEKKVKVGFFEQLR